MENFNILSSLSLLFTSLLGFSLLLYLSTKLWLNPNKIREKLRYQGISGPKPSLLFGNILDMKRISKEVKIHAKEEQSRAHFIDDYISVIFPYLSSWRQTYGQLFQYSIGTVPVLHIADPELVKAIIQCNPFELCKPQYVKKARSALFGETGIVMADAELWAHDRKIIAQEFFMPRVKGMVHVIVDSANTLTEAWKKMLHTEGGKAEIMVNSHLRSFSANIISRVSFGNSYGKGEELFSKLNLLQKAISKADILSTIPGARCLPTKTNREIRQLNKDIRSLVRTIVQEHGQQDSSNRDLLHSLIEGSTLIPNQTTSTEDFIIDNCKTMYFVSFETTSVTATWCLFLLALYPEWQESVRKEVIEVSHGTVPDFNMLRQFKMLTMVIQETLRLFPPGFAILREAVDDMKLQNIHVPKGTGLHITVPFLHRDADTWGPDADVFNPTRFANGISGACKHPHMYAPFGFGPRICVGQNLAMVELKVLLSLLLMRFSFDLSPSYVHSPAYKMTIQPEHDLPLIVKEI